MSIFIKSSKMKSLVYFLVKFSIFIVLAFFQLITSLVCQNKYQNKHILLMTIVSVGFVMGSLLIIIIFTVSLYWIGKNKSGIGIIMFILCSSLIMLILTLVWLINGFKIIIYFICENFLLARLHRRCSHAPFLFYSET